MKFVQTNGGNFYCRRLAWLDDDNSFFFLQRCGELPNSEVTLQRTPDMPGLQLHRRDSSADSLTEFAEFRQSFHAWAN
jgi:hypothetical protein